MAPVPRSIVSDVCRYLDRWWAYRQWYDRVPGVQAAVLHDGDLLLSAAYGRADVERDIPLAADHLFRVASHSKMFTATAVLQLVERGRLRLDDTVAHWIAHLADTPLAPITVRELLAHGGGVIRDGLDGDFWQLTRPFPDDTDLRTMVLSDAAHVLPRNERFKYSNIGYSLLGEVIAAAAARTYADVVEDEILGPLGLGDTGTEWDSARAGRFATGYSSLSYGDGRLPIDHVDTYAMAPATGFYSTAADMVRFAAAHFTGDERILTDDSKRLAQRTEWDVPGTATQYGLGFMIAEVGGRRTCGHSGGYPGHITRTFFEPSDRIAVSVLTNAIDGLARSYASAFFTLLALALKPGPSDSDPPVDDRLLRFEGRFAGLWGATDIAVLGGRLYALSPAALDPAADVDRLEVVDADTLRIADATGYGSRGETVRFVWQPDGTVASVRIGGMTAHPIDAVRAAVSHGGRVSVRRPLGPHEPS